MVLSQTRYLLMNKNLPSGHGSFFFTILFGGYFWSWTFGLFFRWASWGHCRGCFGRTHLVHIHCNILLCRFVLFKKSRGETPKKMRKDLRQTIRDMFVIWFNYFYSILLLREHHSACCSIVFFNIHSTCQTKKLLKNVRAGMPDLSLPNQNWHFWLLWSSSWLFLITFIDALSVCIHSR